MRRLLLTSFFFQYTVVFAWTKTLCGVEYHSTGHLLGTGAFGRVDKAVDPITGQTFAVKFVKTSQQEQHRAFLMEVEAMKLFPGDDNFVQLICHERDSPYSTIVMEYCNQGDLLSYGRLSSSQLLTFWDHLSQALETMHEKKIVHRDLKLENIFLHNGKIKIGDFGLSKYLGKDGMAFDVAGTPSYLAPEQIWRRRYDFKVDLWASGVVLYIQLVGLHPYLPPTARKLNVQILQQHMLDFYRNSADRLSLIKLKHFVPVVEALLETRAQDRRIVAVIKPSRTIHQRRATIRL